MQTGWIYNISNLQSCRLTALQWHLPSVSLSLFLPRSPRRALNHTSPSRIFPPPLRSLSSLWQFMGRFLSSPALMSLNLHSLLYSFDLLSSLDPFPSSFSSPASCNIPPLHPNRFTSAQSKIGDVSEKWLNSASQQLHCEELYMECYYRCGENPFKCLCSVIYSLNFTGLTGIQYIQRSPSD